MKKTILVCSALLFIFVSSFTGKEGYAINDKVENFTLMNVDGKMVSLSDYKDQKGVVVVFTCNHCPYSVMYEDRINMIHNRFSGANIPVIAINPNDPAIQPQDSFKEMQVRAKEKNFQFAYLFDDGQKVFPKFGATRTPHVYLLRNEGDVFTVQYIGAIDDNPQDHSKVNENYLLNAMDAMLSSREISPKTTKAIGCTIKVKK